jgi:biopolymer transport protein ExbB
MARRLARAAAASRLLAVLAAVCLAPTGAHAWWNADWTQRTTVTVDTTAATGVATQAAATGVPLAIRLHSGNFDFLNAKDDGSDLRVVAGDDKTPLPHRVERFDAVNELALVWVQLPTVAPGSDQNTVHVYAGNPAAAAEPGRAYDGATLAAVPFADADNAGADALGTTRASAPVSPELNAVLAGGARLAGTPITWVGPDSWRIAEGAAVTASLWLRADAAAGVQPAGAVLRWGPLAISLQDGRPQARVGTVTLAAPDAVAPGTWVHLALAIGGGQARLHVNGAEAARADVATPAVAGDVVVGGDINGAVDELQISSVARSADWLTIAAASQGPDGKLVRSVKDAGEAADGGSHGYMGILVENLTLDAWIVIVILAVMFVVACWVMVAKSVLVGRADRDNRSFLSRFRGATDDLLHLDQGAAHPHSSLYRLYEAGLRELKKRQVGEAGAQPLSGASLDAVKAAVDADMVRESHKLNSQMVLLTIAISGGPFLGLLGTVVGVMITFAAIAAAGDVNVNAIAPGIAAALLATVAGLAVAIPALFGYNYLASRIKNISSDMQIFVDEFITRVAELYGAR